MELRLVAAFIYSAFIINFVMYGNERLVYSVLFRLCRPIIQRILLFTFLNCQACIFLHAVLFSCVYRNYVIITNNEQFTYLFTVLNL